MTEPTPTITLPLEDFLELLWGYKKGSELRERAVPGNVIVNAIKQIPNYENYVHIQEPETNTQLATVWQKKYWKESGERQIHYKAELQKEYTRAEWIALAIKEKLPMLPIDVCSGIAYQIEHNKNYSALAPFGITPEQIEKEV